MTLELQDYEREELNFLRFFYSQAKPAMGPADSEIYQGIKDAYNDGWGTVPEPYEVDDE